MARRAAALALVALVALVLGAAPARAQTDGFRIDRFRPAPTSEDGLGMQYARTLGHLVPSVGLVLDYAHAPLVATTSAGERGEIVSHRFVAHVVGALGLADFLEIHVRLPVAFSASDAPVVGGRLFPAPDVVGLGDGALGASVALFSEGRRGFTLGLVAEGMWPWGTRTSYASDTELSGRAQVLATIALERLTISGALGALYRPERTILVAHAGSELEAALGVLFSATSELDLLLEAVGAASLPQGQSHPVPLELMLGGRYRAGATGLAIDAGVGAGLSLAPGVPDVRVILGVRWLPPPPPVGDTDGDGLLDDADACPTQAEDEDGWLDGDGCVDPDDDADGWMDEDDACPRAQEDRDGFSDVDGCPDPDDDGDGVLDEDDACPRAPGESFQHGCPQLVRIAEDHIELVWPIDFAEGSAAVPVSAGGALSEIARTLAIDEGVTRWRIAVRAVPVSRRDDGVALALARAQAIVTAMVALGIEASRFEPTTLPAGPGAAIEITSLGATVHHAPPPPRPAAPEAPPPVRP